MSPLGGGSGFGGGGGGGGGGAGSTGPTGPTGATGATGPSYANSAITVTSNAGTASATQRIQTFTNSSAATMAITISTSGAVDGFVVEIRIYDFSAVAETIGWTNTEASTVPVPVLSNGSTTLPLTVLFQFNGVTSKWRCLSSV